MLSTIYFRAVPIGVGQNTYRILEPSKKVENSTLSGGQGCRLKTGKKFLFPWKSINQWFYEDNFLHIMDDIYDKEFILEGFQEAIKCILLIF